METRTLQINNVTELVQAFSDSKKLYGYKPAEEYDSNTFVYPITVTVNEKDKTFTVKQNNEEVKEEVKEEKTETVSQPTTSSSSNNDAAAKAKKKKIGMIVGFTILGVVVVVGIALAIYFGVK